MASPFLSLHQNLPCSICLLFNDPEKLSCGCNICRTCRIKNPGRECPSCKRWASKEHPLVDMRLRNPRESLLWPTNQGEVRISALRKEQEERIQRMNGDFDEVHRQMKEDLRREMERPLYAFPNPQLHPGALTDVAKDLENLRSRAFERMEDFGPHFPLVLDPITPTSYHTISANLSSAPLCTERPTLLDNPETINVSTRVQVPEMFPLAGIGENQVNGVRVTKESIYMKEYQSFSRHFSYYKEEQH